MHEIEFIVQNESPTRIDTALTALVLESKIDGYEDVTRSRISAIIEEQSVTVNGKLVSKNCKVKLGDKIKVSLPEQKPCEAVAQNIPLDVVYEDSDLLVVNKPKGMVVHPANGHEDETLVNALLAHCGDSLSGIGGVMRPGIVHRIDKDTSGLLIVAKNDFAHNKLSEMIKEHSFVREYVAVVYGNFKEKKGTINAPIGRHPTKRQQMSVVCQPFMRVKSAVTHYTVLEQYNGFSLLRLRLETGRTHQIRVHLSSIGHPVAGDPVYGPKPPIAKLNGQCLHAQHIEFMHPRSGQVISLSSNIPTEFDMFLNKIGGKASSTTGGNND